jgi:hypothetical protein
MQIEIQNRRKEETELACPTEASGTQGSKAQVSSETMLAHVTVRPKKKLKSTHLMKETLNTYKELMIHLINSHGLPSTLVESPQLRTLVQFLISKGTILSQFPPEELHIERRKVEIISRLQIKQMFNHVSAICVVRHCNVSLMTADNYALCKH